MTLPPSMRAARFEEVNEPLQIEDMPTTRTAQGIAESQRKAFEALTDNFASAGKRSTAVAGSFTDLLKLQESNARVIRDLFTSGVRFAELQQRNISFAQEWISGGINFWRDQAQQNVRTAEVVAQSAREQQEGFRKLAEQWAEVYEDFFSSWVSYSQEGLKSAQQVTQQVAEQATQVTEQTVEVAERVAEQATQVTQQVAKQGLQATEQSTRQGLRLAEEATEQTEQVVKQVDPNHLPVEGYDELNVSEISGKLDGLSVEELEKVKNYERRNKNRETLIGQIERKIKAAS